MAATEAELGVLLAGARAGSGRAFEEIYRELSPAVASYLRWHGAHDVDALTNQVMADVHRALPRFQGEWVGFRSFVFTIAHHRLVDDLRSFRRRPVVVGEPTEELAGRGDVEDDAFSGLGTDRVHHLLSTLSEDQREVLLLRVVADLALDDVAKIIGKSVGAVKALQHRALARLRKRMDHEEAGR